MVFLEENNHGSFDKRQRKLPELPSVILLWNKLVTLGCLNVSILKVLSLKTENKSITEIKFCWILFSFHKIYQLVYSFSDIHNPLYSYSSSLRNWLIYNNQQHLFSHNLGTKSQKEYFNLWSNRTNAFLLKPIKYCTNWLGFK